MRKGEHINLMTALYNNNNNNNIIILYFRHLSIYTIKHNYKKYIHTIKKNKYITVKK